MCIAACAAAKYAFCGTQYNRECWGGPTIPNLKVDETSCDFPCKGNINQICGGNGVGSNQGGSYISLFADSLQFNGNTTAPGAPSGPFVNPGVGGYTSIGCYTESTTGRALPNGKTTTTKTVASCVAACSVGSYKYAGLEYGGECWCGNAFTAGSVPTAITDCKMPCNDNGTEYCGAGQRLNVYQFGAIVSTSSSVSSSRSSTSTSRSSTSISVTNTSKTSSSSTSSLSSSSSTVSPVTTSTSSSSISTSTSQSSSSVSSTSSSVSSSSSGSSSSSVSTTSSSSTSQTSSSSSSSVSSTSSSVSSSSSVSTSSSSTATPTQTSPAIKPTIDNWTRQGCWTESTTGRALSGATYANDLMTLESCAAFCRGFTMFGVEYGRECYCGNFLNAGSVAADNQADCNFLCPGNKLEYCGAGRRLELYSSVATSSSTTSSTSSVSTSARLTTTSSSSQTTPTSIPTSRTSTTTSSTSPIYTGPPVTSNGNVNFTYYSCISEPSSGRLLPSQIENNGIAMTIPKCLSNCWMYKYAGVEYGRECWCGNTLNIAGNAGATPAMNVSDSQCSFTCPGNSSEFCGAGGRLSLFWFDTAKAASNKG